MLNPLRLGAQCGSFASEPLERVNLRQVGHSAWSRKCRRGQSRNTIHANSALSLGARLRPWPNSQLGGEASAHWPNSLLGGEASAHWPNSLLEVWGRLRSLAVDCFLIPNWSRSLPTLCRSLTNCPLQQSSQVLEESGLHSLRSPALLPSPHCWSTRPFRPPALRPSGLCWSTRP